MLKSYQKIFLKYFGTINRNFTLLILNMVACHGKGINVTVTTFKRWNHKKNCPIFVGQLIKVLKWYFYLLFKYRKICIE